MILAGKFEVIEHGTNSVTLRHEETDREYSMQLVSGAPKHLLQMLYVGYTFEGSLEIADPMESRYVAMLRNVGYRVILDESRGIGLVCDPPSAKCFWGVTSGFQVLNTDSMQVVPFRVRYGLN